MSAPEPAPRHPAHTFAVVDGLRLHLLRYPGEGPRVLLLHGVLGSAWMWSEVVRHLPAAWDVTAIDLRGYGASQWSATQAYATTDHAGDVLALAEHLGWERLHLVGFSWGALIGLAAAERRPELVERLVMIDLAPSSEREPHAVPPVTMSVASHSEAVAAERAAVPGIVEAMAETMACHGRRPAEGGALVRCHDPLFTRYWPFLAEDWWATLERHSGPLLVVHGTDSLVCSAGEAVEMVRRAPAAELVEIGPSGHLIPLERPAELAVELTRFLDEGP